MQVPYTMDSSLDGNDVVQGVLAEALVRYHSATAVRFVPRASQLDYLTFFRMDGACASHVGRVGGQQAVYVDGQGGCGAGKLVHVLGHALGFLHAPNRPDADAHARLSSPTIDLGARAAAFPNHAIACGMPRPADAHDSLLPGSALEQHLDASQPPSRQAFMPTAAVLHGRHPTGQGETSIGQAKLGFGALDAAAVQHVYDRCMDAPPPSECML